MYLHLNQYSHVDEIVALSKHPLKEAENYLQLYDMHERYLNNLLQQYEEKLIPDFYEFFRHPWACAIFHDRFSDFMEEVKENLETIPVKVCMLHDTLRLTTLRRYTSSWRCIAGKKYFLSKLDQGIAYRGRHVVNPN